MVNTKKILIAGIAILVIMSAYIFSSYSPTIAIRKHLFFYNPIQSFTCIIQPTALGDIRYGNLYIIDRFDYKSSGNPICFAYVNRNFLGLYYWSGGGRDFVKRQIEKGL